MFLENDTASVLVESMRIQKEKKDSVGEIIVLHPFFFNDNLINDIEFLGQ